MIRRIILPDDPIAKAGIHRGAVAGGHRGGAQDKCFQFGRDGDIGDGVATIERDTLAGKIEYAKAIPNLTSIDSRSPSNRIGNVRHFDFANFARIKRRNKIRDDW
jgi:hypothetical protein